MTWLRRIPLWAAVSVFAIATGLIASASSSWQRIEALLFDQLTVQTAPRKSVLPITIVGIDEASFVEVNQKWPWPRELHARLIDALVADGAAVIAFDILFPEASSAADDAAFAESIRKAHNVVLAADHAYQETATLRRWLRVDPLPDFLQSGAVSGLASAAVDGDGVVRRFPEAPDIFWRQVIAVFQRERPDLQVSGGIPDGGLIRHLGPAYTFPYVPYYQVLAGGDGLPPGFFKDQIVLVGRAVRASPEIGMAQADLFSTPFQGESQLLTPGVEIQATLVENALTGQALAPMQRWHTISILLVVALLAMPALRWWHPLAGTAWIGLLSVATLALAYAFFTARSEWLPVMATLLTLALMLVSMGMGSFIAERRRAAQIKGTFSRYVAPQVVEQMVARPELVRLGGERRELTILFTDLAGFTQMSEQLAPEVVADIINLYLTEMTRLIIEQGGTVDKFIGDAIMAFWNAPLDDHDHAYRAVTTAVAMQNKMDQIQPLFVERGAQGLAMRVGIHSGPAIVGNMGSEDRFDYTALGDSVNLASRLEGANKVYGTRILLSATTADQLRSRIGLRPVDRVKVQGKRLTVDIYTPCDDAELIRKTGEALSAYHEMQWQKARSQWKAILDAQGGDPLSEVFLARIERWEAQPPIDWNGAASLEK